MNLPADEDDRRYVVRHLNREYCDVQDIYPAFSKHGIRIVSADQCKGGLAVKFRNEHLAEAECIVTTMNNSGQLTRIFLNIIETSLITRDLFKGNTNSTPNLGKTDRRLHRVNGLQWFGRGNGLAVESTSWNPGAGVRFFVSAAAGRRYQHWARWITA